MQEQLDAAYAERFKSAADHERHDLLVCHGNVIRYLVCRALGVEPHAWVNFYPLAHCSLTTIIIAPKGILEAREAGITLTTLYSFNAIGHLPPELLSF